jgi:glycosyltransferase involved in cell wall biosynthesis
MNSENRYPRISIITPTYNQSNFITRTIDSVLSQNYPNLEYIVMDGGSTDNTLTILESFNGKIIWSSEKDNGQADAINKGIKLSTGEIVAFINSDDYYLPGVFQDIANTFLSRPEIKWITGSYKIIDQNDNDIQTLTVLYKDILRSVPLPVTLKLTNYIVQPSTFWKREVHDSVGYFNQSLRYTFDYDFWLRMIDRYPLYKTNLPLSAFRIHPDSKGGKEYDAQFTEEFEVLKQYNHNKIIQLLHKIHNDIIVGLYRRLK